MSYILGHSAATPGWYVITVGGECDLNAAPALSVAVEAAFQHGASTIVVDLQEVTFIDSTAIGILLAARERLRRSGGTFEVVCSVPAVVRVLEIVGMETVAGVP
ncbi:MAG TPA: STAS domain-containing protein [Thermoleophilaceae bacterium]|nr:STAS domain-containing protein [Thermoleophilaceae bacterium]